MDFDSEGRTFVGETNREWGSAVPPIPGLEYLTWTGRHTLFEMKIGNGKPDGFENLNLQCPWKKLLRKT